MRLCVAYIAVRGLKETAELVARFASTWHEFPPGEETDFLAICNGGELSSEQKSILSTIKNVRFFPRSNNGWDILGHIEASKGPLNDYDMVLYCGGSVYFWKSGWLKRLADAYRKWGHGMYGPFGTHVVRAHLQTTAFATSPKLLSEYPLPVMDKSSRYEFEHGERAFWRMVKRKYPVKLVTWNGEYDPPHWRLPANVIWKGDQSNVLMRCNHTEFFDKLPSQRKRSWQQSADRPYK